VFSLLFALSSSSEQAMIEKKNSPLLCLIKRTRSQPCIVHC
jgi:hypothetical protein